MHWYMTYMGMQEKQSDHKCHHWKAAHNCKGRVRKTQFSTKTTNLQQNVPFRYICLNYQVSVDTIVCQFMYT